MTRTNMGRKNGWTEDHDLKLAEIVLKFTREGKTQSKAFEEAAKVLKRTAGACSFGWNNNLRDRYEKAIELAKMGSANKEEKVTSPSSWNFLGDEGERQEKVIEKPKDKKETTKRGRKKKQKTETKQERTVMIDKEKVYSLKEIIGLLEKYVDAYEESQDRIKELEEENGHLKNEINHLKEQKDFVSDDYNQVVEILNRARQMIS